MEFREISSNELPLELLSSFWVAWFEAEPWAERFRCPLHNAIDDFSSVGRFKDPGTCPDCGTNLVPYWTQDRIDTYLREVFAKRKFWCFAGIKAGKVVAWAWGYSADDIKEFDDLPRGGLYIDHIGFDPSHKEDEVGAMLEQGWEAASSRGFSFVVTRTHKHATYVMEAIAPYGYRFLRDCKAEPDREYWAMFP